MLFAELAILIHFDAIGSVLFVFVRPVVAIFANGAGQGDIRPHNLTSNKIYLVNYIKCKQLRG